MTKEKQSAKITEQPSPYRHLEQMSTVQLVQHINEEDGRVAATVQKVLPSIVSLIDALAEKLRGGGRLFYVGAGTSGRLGLLDASEWAPTYGVPETMVNAVMAGGPSAYRFGIDDAEDSFETGWKDLQSYKISPADFVIGLAASGTTPYVVGALRESRKRGILTGCVVCNWQTPVAAEADFPIEAIVGPEFVTGSTRMKAGTAQKMILNMISTAVMIRLGRVQDNRMVHMQISNKKLIDRGARMLMEKAGITDYETAKSLLLKHGSVYEALKNYT